MPCVRGLLATWTASREEADHEDDTNEGELTEYQIDGIDPAGTSARAHPEEIPLYFPSALPDHLCVSRPMASLVQKEIQLCVAIGDDSLADIRRLRRTMAGIAQFKHSNVSGTGQKPNTRIRSLYTKFQDKVSVAAKRYRAAHAALLTLDPNGQWSTRLRHLADKDISSPGNDDDEDRPLGEGRRELSWIWRVPRPNGEQTDDDDTFDQTLQIEWTKTRARARRWAEEVELIQEEMCRVLAFFKWKSEWWRGQQGRNSDKTSAALRVGLKAYAEKQASMYEELAIKFRNLWVPFFTVRQLHAEWVASQFSVAQDPSRASASVPVKRVIRLPADSEPESNSEHDMEIGNASDNSG
ncbi:hypothetical protein BC629DRAFT_1444458 [Irpex lacteus]|nr:hypothetical protein BC629DRAFT_1444458 [Irpex lacteus]